MQENLNIKYIYSWLIILKIKIKSYVKNIYFLRQFASINLLNNKFIVQRLNHYSDPKGSNIEQFDENFKQWLVGFTDGDGSFSITKNNTNWILVYKISQHKYNIRILYYIKNKLNIGKINKEKKTNMVNYRITKLEHIGKYIIPLFDKYPCLTSKQFNYLKFKEAYYILINKDMSKEEKNSKLNILKLKILSKLDYEYISPIWNNINKYNYSSILEYFENVINLDKNLWNEFNKKLSTLMNKNWIIGFIEAEGSFYIFKKDINRYEMGFGITQKLDPHVLYSIKFLLYLDCKIRKKIKHNYYILDSCVKSDILNIIDYFFYSMKGMKRFEFVIWRKCINKTNIEKLKIQTILRNLKKNF